ncbi:hypothetical protein ATK36_3005 [Amycolatopsis sulphurea]|uniref:Uncharacterized protein n=1 Tax=Amycolatopsis sulphurea TaxID=76022 RepID=A0A2A9FBX9_9PSEU|nr:hypothetical protein [Amycolatopsis sulphurea]PFG47939.1 hypothetical protein ATK36_3005 [Amycolatopsis sulphurea]
MTILRKVGAAGLIAGAALVFSTGATANATPPTGKIYPTYGSCLTDGNKLAQQGALHGFYCAQINEGGRVAYQLIRTS